MIDSRHSSKYNGLFVLGDDQDCHEALKNAPIGVFTSTPAGGPLSANPAMARMLGYDTPDELISSVTDIALQVYADPRDRESFIRLLEKQGWLTNHKCRLRRKDGTIISISSNVRAVRDKDGLMVACQGFCTEITEGKELEDQYRGIFDASKDPMLILDMEGVIRDINQAACELYGYMHEEMIGLSGRDLVHPDFQHLFGEFLKTAARGGTFFTESLDIRKDGSTFSSEVKGGVLHFRNRPHFFAIVRDISRRRQAQAAMERVRHSLDMITDSVFWVDEAGDFWDVNEAACRNLGYSRDELLNMGVADIDPHCSSETWPHHWEEMKRCKVMKMETTHQTKDGRMLPVEVVVHNQQFGGIQYNYVLARDITDIKRAEAELADQKARYQGIWNEAPVSIWEEDWSGVLTILQRLQDQGVQDYPAYFDQHPEVVEEALRAVKILDVNEETVRMFRGRDKDEFMHSLQTVFATPDTLPGFIGELVALAEGSHTYRTEMCLRNVDKELIHVLLTMSFFPKNAKPGMVLVSLVDITDKKIVEKALKHERERFFMLLETFPGFIYLQAPDYSVRYVNKFFMDQFGDPSGKHCYEVMWGRTAPCELCPTFKVFDTKTPQEWEWLHAPDGRSYAVHDYPFIDSDGTELVLEIGIDITRRKQAEEKIMIANEQLQRANAEKDKLFSIIAHDLKSPMAGVFSTSQILAREAESLPVEDIRNISAEMHKSSKNILELLNDLMQWARISQGGMDFSPEECSLYELVNSSLHTAHDMAGKKQITIQSDIPEDFTVQADQPMIKTVLRNVTINAVKFTHRGGNISITARVAQPFVEVCIRDDGIGMSEKILSTVFSVDKAKRQLGTDDEKGTGFGLILCKEFVEKHGGEIRLESEPGKGTKVFFTLQSVS
ncbi:PAS domain S-box protein [Desulfonatronospira sp.]|uniref:PAS domain S-box protein n=1 Tax=Desulfonatronospira sp. TaxID=1962951 RepID=UPI0025BB1AE0|nr:PAS domain S-box protein [Desulfonatronospira sp.]